MIGVGVSQSYVGLPDLTRFKSGTTPSATSVLDRRTGSGLIISQRNSFKIYLGWSVSPLGVSDELAAFGRSRE